ncbi:MAG TPA: VOC family protein [Cyclobacteriaceae bacterium]|nr:VOC family protein [Cyclobacteriaceae bacterium]
MKIAQKITPFLWFDDNAEEAINFYISVFENSRIVNVSRYGDAGPGPKGTLMAASFELAGQQFNALNGGPLYKFTEAVSFLVSCDTQEEIDKYWKVLSDGGEEQMCGWLKDKYGLSWQIIPPILSELLSDKDPGKAGRAMQAMLKMKKIDINALKTAHAGQELKA